MENTLGLRKVYRLVDNASKLKGIITRREKGGQRKEEEA